MAGVGKTSVLRMSGINSGLDTEAIVEAMTAATKLKITTNQRKVLKLEAQQEAYRGIIDKVNEFKNKYFDILNSSTYLKTSGGFNKYSASVSSNGLSGSPSGVKVTTNSSAVPANYKVTVDAVATQSKYTSTALDAKQTIDLSEFDDVNSTYAMKVTVGGTSKVISFNGGADDDEVLENINRALEVFGESNSGGGLVSVVRDGTSYKFNSLEKKAITTSNAVELGDAVNLGTNFSGSTDVLTFTINGETQSVSLATIKQDYFNELFTGTIDPDTGYAEGADSNVIKRYEEVVNALYQDHLGEAYETFMAADDYHELTYKYDDDWAQMNDAQKATFEAALTAKQEEQWTAKYDAKLEEIYNSLPAGKITGANYVPYNQWLEDFKQEYTLNDFKDDFTMEAQYAAHAEAEYAAYSSAEGDDALGYDEWYKDWSKEDGNSLSDFRDANTDWSGRYADFADNEYEMYREYQISKNSNQDGSYKDGFDPDTDIVSKADWLAEFEQTYSAADYKKAFTGSDVVVAEREMYFNMGYNEYKAYVSETYTGISEEEFLEDYKDEGIDGAKEAAAFYNERSIQNSVESVKFDDGTKLEATISKAADGTINGVTIKAYTEDEDGVKTYVDLGVTSANGEYGLEETTAVTNTVSTSTKLSELGLTADEEAVYDSEGNLVTEAQYKMSINGVDFSFDASTSISKMMSTINSSKAGVTMSFSSLTNSFELTSKEYGVASDFQIDGNNQILGALGFDTGSYTRGSNLSLTVNGVSVETSSNTYTVDGTTFSFNSLTEVGTSFDVEVSRDTEGIKDLVKQFVNDYNDLIKYVYGFVDEKPDNDYHFLTDDDLEEMALTESQEEKWEKVAKKGLLYNDSTLTNMMSKFRTALYSANTDVDGNSFALYSMGITTSSNYASHGLLSIKEDDFNAAFETNYEDIVALFTNSANGIMTQFDKVIEQSVKTTGEVGTRGTLVEKAGTANGSSATNNTIYNQIKKINTMIDSLERRYEQQQDRYWSIYTALEQQMGSLNSQTSYISQLMGSQ